LSEPSCWGEKYLDRALGCRGGIADDPRRQVDDDVLVISDRPSRRLADRQSFPDVEHGFHRRREQRVEQRRVIPGRCIAFPGWTGSSVGEIGYREGNLLRADKVGKGLVKGGSAAAFDFHFGSEDFRGGIGDGHLELEACVLRLNFGDITDHFGFCGRLFAVTAPGFAVPGKSFRAGFNRHARR